MVLRAQFAREYFGGKFMSGRLSQSERRSQLVAIGAKLLHETSFSDFSIDTVAREAGISRSLLFHYFNSKHEYLTAVIHRSADFIIGQIELPNPESSTDPLYDTIVAFTRFVRRRRNNYLAVFRAPSQDPALHVAVDDMYNRIARNLLAAAGLDSSTPGRLMLARCAVAAIEMSALQSESLELDEEETADINARVAAMLFAHADQFEPRHRANGTHTI